jgi:hypothetical protein
LVVADGQLGGIIVFFESINAISSTLNIAACFETTSPACKPAFAFVVVDEDTEDVFIDSFPDDMR